MDKIAHLLVLLAIWFSALCAIVCFLILIIALEPEDEAGAKLVEEEVFGFVNLFLPLRIIYKKRSETKQGQGY